MDLEQVNTEDTNDGIDMISIYIDICENGTLEDFIKFAKEYNIFQVPRAKVYTKMCERIKARLDREGLDYEIVRPE